jgi:hypothetical protein
LGWRGGCGGDGEQQQAGKGGGGGRFHGGSVIERMGKKRFGEVSFAREFVFLWARLVPI